MLGPTVLMAGLLGILRPGVVLDASELGMFIVGVEIEVPVRYRCEVCLSSAGFGVLLWTQCFCRPGL